MQDSTILKMYSRKTNYEASTYFYQYIKFISLHRGLSPPLDNYFSYTLSRRITFPPKVDPNREIYLLPTFLYIQGPFRCRENDIWNISSRWRNEEKTCGEGSCGESPLFFVSNSLLVLNLNRENHVRDYFINKNQFLNIDFQL